MSFFNNLGLNLKTISSSDSNPEFMEANKEFALLPELLLTDFANYYQNEYDRA
jgi:hypothetical protein